ncbi:Mu transposase C-terminal domain-containing protein [Shewanella bicestrii]
MLLAAPTAIKTVSRFGTVNMDGDQYFSEDLGSFVGKQVRVRYGDKNTRTAIGVFTPEGKHICVAYRVKKVGFGTLEQAKKQVLKIRCYRLKALRNRI